MYEMFEKAIGFVLDYYSIDEKSSANLCTYRKYLNKVRAFLVSQGLEYSHDEALAWLSKELEVLSYDLNFLFFVHRRLEVIQPLAAHA